MTDTEGYRILGPILSESKMAYVPIYNEFALFVIDGDSDCF